MTYEVTNPSNTEISVFEPLRKMHNIVSKAVKEIFHFKEGSQPWNTIEKKEINASETKRESSQSLSEAEDDLSQPFVKHEVKLRNKNKFEPLSLFGLILISVLLGTAGAGKIRSEDNNKIYRKDPSWSNTRIDTKKHEDLIIDAYNCLENSQPSTQILLKAPKKCEVTDVRGRVRVRELYASRPSDIEVSNSGART